MRYGDVYLAGIGTYLPPVASADDAVAAGRYSADEHRRNGITGTPVAAAAETPPEMAVTASKKALAAAGLRGADLELVLFGSQWDPQHGVPAAYVHHAVGGRPDVGTLEVRQGCSGAVTMLDLAARHLRTTPGGGAVLISTADRFCLPSWDRYSSDEGYIWGDAASALVVTSEPAGIARLVATATHSFSAAEEVCRGSILLDAERGNLPLLMRGHKQRFYKKFGPLSFRREFQHAVRDTATRALAEAGTGAGEVAWALVPNMGLQWRGWALLEPLGVDETRTTWTDHGRHIGHTGLADQALALEFLLNRGALQGGDRVLLLAVGIGLTFSAAVLEIV